MPEEQVLLPEPLAARIFRTAIVRQCAAELFACLTSGGSATIDATGALILITGEMLDSAFGFHEDLANDGEKPPTQVLNLDGAGIDATQ